MTTDPTKIITQWWVRRIVPASEVGIEGAVARPAEVGPWHEVSCSRFNAIKLAADRGDWYGKQFEFDERAVPNVPVTEEPW